ncbi:DUF927 domain-containing protein [Deefgea tanakiae]|uniref:DUF927 domain-containing protein n=1 Tax=Deefgea tanakiae TaxID=2865840 RepID=A0ABX8Z405_9NEIS|nr:DUF927 domain-containing protein [Deefgea tanakiae]QZA77291.1 DUF927 domain-containing protein [Deefgea tanakiae]
MLLDNLNMLVELMPALDAIEIDPAPVKTLDTPKSTGNKGNTGNSQKIPNENASCDGTGVFPETKKEQGTVGNRAEKSPFFVTGDGVYWLDMGNEDAPSLRLCSPLTIVAKTRDTAQGNWGRYLQWFDDDNHLHTWACPAELLAASDTAEFRKELARQGLTIATNSKARQKLVDYVLSYSPQSAIPLRCVTRIGWFADRYVLPDAAYGAESDEGVIYQGATASDYEQAGTLADWKKQIAAPAAGNSRIVFALSVAFAGVLAEMAGESGGGFHFVGTTSKGKTSTLLDPAASVWGNPDRFAKKWRTTTNGLESLCAGRNDGLLILDELAQIAAQEAGSAAYLIANGQAKARMTKEGGNRPVQTWRVMLLSAGEIDLAQHMAEAGKSAKGGQMARLPAIPADAGAGLGTLEQLQQFNNGQAFADHMKNQSRQQYGTAGCAFIEQLCAQENLIEVRDSIRADMQAICEQFEVAKTAPAEVGRVAARFALVAFAGELATQYGVTGWQAGEAFKAAKQCFQAWYSSVGAEFGADDRALFSQVSAFMQAHSNTRFPAHDASDEVLARHNNRAGFRYEDGTGQVQFWVMTEAFKNEICKGYKPADAARILKAAGWMLEGDKEATQLRNTQKKRIKALGAKTQSVYVFTERSLGGAE